MERHDLAAENEKLARMWNQHDAQKLRDYLVASVEDPRLNFQSILSRHFIASLVFGDRLDGLKVQEFKFAAAMNWLHHAIRRRLHPDDWHAMLHALEQGADNAEGIEIPWFLVQLYKALPVEVNGVVVPNYLRDAFSALAQDAAPSEVPGLGLFESLWRQRLEQETVGERVSVWEAACGSANDYRFVASFGLARFIDYTGIDISEKNVANATAMFPGARFLTASVFEVPLESRSVRACYFHDLLEHLSLDGLAQAVSEICRVTEKTICGGFFSLHEGEEHIVRPLEEYHCNSLSRVEVDGLFRQHGFAARPVHIESYARTKLGFFETHNAQAYTIYFDRVNL